MRASVWILVLAAALTLPARASAGPDTRSAPDYSKLSLSGNGMWQDSLCLAVQAAARVFGRDAEYDMLYCLSGNAFAPAIDLAEECAAHWHCEARLADRAMGSLAGSAGLRARRLTFPEPAGSLDDAAIRWEHMRDVAGVVRRAMNAGRVVVTTSGWDWEGPHGFTHWAWAGIATSADPETGKIEGAHPNGFLDNPVRWPAAMWELWPGGEALSTEEADRQMLRMALDRIQRRGPFRRSGSDVFGLPAMDAWTKHMRKVAGFCAPCYGRHLKDPKSASSYGDAVDNVRHLRHGAETVAAVLRKRMLEMPAACRAHLEQAARRYDRVALLLGPALEGDGPEGYRQVLGDLAKQRAHADRVLVPVRDEIAAAAGDLQAALNSMGR